MKFITEKQEIVEFLQMGAAIATRKRLTDIATNLKISARNNLVEITGTDYQIQLKAKTSVKSLVDEGETIVSAIKISDLCRSLPEKEELEFSLDKGKLTVKSKNFHADLSTLSSDDFPEFEMQKPKFSLQIPSVLFKRILNKTLFCMATTEVRMYLNGTLIEIKNSQIRAVASDGTIMGVVTRDLNELKGENLALILPSKAAQELAKIFPAKDSPIEILFGDSFIRVKNENLDFTSKVIDHKYPDYEEHFPTGDSNKMVILKENLSSALQRASVLSDDKRRFVKFMLTKNCLELLAHNEQQEAAEEIVETEYIGPEMETAFNIDYLQNVLHAIDGEKVDFYLYGEEKPCEIREPGNDSEVYLLQCYRL